MMDSTVTAWRRARRSTAGAALAASVVLASGCSGTLEEAFPDRQPSYRSSKSTSPLEVPPDLSSSTLRDSLQIPELGATYSQYADEDGGVGNLAESAVLPEIDDARIERSGDQRWLVIALTPDEVWPRLRDFWIAQGFALETEEPDIGVMETDWAEEQTPLPAGLLKRALLTLSNKLYGVAVRDRYRTRIERGTEPGTTEIYISHRGAEQMVVGDESSYAQREGLGERVWQLRPNDPGLEAEMLTRLMAFLGVDKGRADTLVAERDASEPRASLVKDDGGAASLLLAEDFSRAWRRTSLALDRTGFTVEDRDRSRGLFFVRYTGQGDEESDEKAGWFSWLDFGGSDANEETADAYLIRIAKEAQDAARITVLDRDGAREERPVAQRILNLLLEQLR